MAIKKRSFWLVALSLIMCLSMLFCSCSLINPDDEDEDVEKTPEEEKEIIADSLQSLNMGQMIESGLEEYNISFTELLKGVMAEASISTTIDGERVNIYGGINENLIKFDAAGESAYIHLTDENVVLFSKYGEGYRVSVENISVSPEDIVDAPSDMVSSITEIVKDFKFPEIKADQLEEKDGFYVIKNDYYESVAREIIDLLIEVMAELEGEDSYVPTDEEIQEVVEQIKGIIEALDLEIGFSVGDETINGFYVSINTTEDAMSEFFGSIGEMAPALPDDEPNYVETWTEIVNDDWESESESDPEIVYPDYDYGYDYDGDGIVDEEYTFEDPNYDYGYDYGYDTDTTYTVDYPEYEGMSSVKASSAPITLRLEVMLTDNAKNLKHIKLNANIPADDGTVVIDLVLNSIIKKNDLVGVEVSFNMTATNVVIETDYSVETNKYDQYGYTEYVDIEVIGNINATANLVFDTSKLEGDAGDAILDFDVNVNVIPKDAFCVDYDYSVGEETRTDVEEYFPSFNIDQYKQSVGITADITVVDDDTLDVLVSVGMDDVSVNVNGTIETKSCPNFGALPGDVSNLLDNKNLAADMAELEQIAETIQEEIYLYDYGFLPDVVWYDAQTGIYVYVSNYYYEFYTSMPEDAEEIFYDRATGEIVFPDHAE